MRINFKAMESYGADNLMSQASVADGAELIQMLFDGLVNSIAEAQGHIEHGAILEKGKSITRACRIVLGLQQVLDFQKGGELAQNLNDLYGYFTRRLIYANARNDIGALNEVLGLTSEIRKAWLEVPAQIQSNASMRLQ
jgi:flagellar protein FliS